MTIRICSITLLVATSILTRLPAQVSFTGTYAQNFNGLSLGAVNSTAAWTDNTTLTGWYFGLRGSGNSYSTPTVYTTKITNGNVSANAGPISPAFSTGATDRALGMQPSTGTSVTSTNAPMQFGLRLNNATGATINAITLTFTAEQWSQGYSTASRNEKMAFSYSTTATGLNVLPAAGNTYTTVSDLLFTSPVATQTTTSTTTIGIDGNNSANRTTYSNYSLTIVGGWAAGTDLWLRWYVPEDLPASSRGGVIAVDDLSITVAPVSGAPAITTHPASLSVAAGDAATFSVVATGDPVLTYQWRKNATPIAGAIASTYQIASTDTSSAGNYDVVVANGLGSITSNIATLTVSGPAGAPTVTTQPTAQSGTLGATVTFAVAATGDPVLTYQWRKNTVAITGATSATLVLSNLDTPAAGNYDVVISNSLGSVTSSSVALTVSGMATAPDITTQPLAQSVNAGANVTFSVVATGVPSPALQWRKSGVPIPGANSSSLTLNAVTTADAAGYDVVVSNSAGSVTSYQVTLIVGGQLGPTLYYQPTSHQIAVGSSLTLRAIAIGSPAVTYQWFRDGLAITGATNSSYTINPAQSGDAGSYTVVVTNSLGSLTSTPATVDVVSATVGSVLRVDRRGGTPYATIAAAAAVARPGDTVELVAGSGPYRETIYLTTSGTEAAPIVIEGNGELVTGFTPFQFTAQSDGQWTYTLPAPLEQTLPGGNSNLFRQLVSYHGQRLLADQVKGTQSAIKFTTNYATLSADGLTLVLNPASGASPTEGWEIGGSIDYGVRIANTTSHHIYRNLRVSGVAIDGFNIHGYAKNIRFENIQAFNNFDEGYSSHDVTETIIDGGVFWGNDNGLLNQTRDTLVCVASNIKSFSNLGSGYGAKAGVNVLHNVEVWDNGVQNLTVGGTNTMSGVITYKARWTARPWVAFQESQNYTIAGKQAGDYASVLYTNVNFGPLIIGGETPQIREATVLPPLLLGSDDWRALTFSSTEFSDTTISGWSADPDRDGLSNLLEYALGLDPHVGEARSVELSLLSDQIAIGYSKRKYNTDVRYVPEASPDLAAWTSGAAATVETVLTDADGVPGFDIVVARDLQSLGSATKRFMRLRVERP